VKTVYITLIIINLYGFISMGYDKLQAKSGKVRIPEMNFFITAFLGGAAGVFLGMKVFRHKTKHYSFLIGIPLLLGLNILIVYYLGRRFF